jgi:hypothetical protein
MRSGRKAIELSTRRAIPSPSQKNPRQTIGDTWAVIVNRDKDLLARADQLAPRPHTVLYGVLQQIAQRPPQRGRPGTNGHDVEALDCHVLPGIGQIIAGFGRER